MRGFFTGKDVVVVILIVVLLCIAILLSQLVSHIPQPINPFANNTDTTLRTLNPNRLINSDIQVTSPDDEWVYFAFAHQKRFSCSTDGAQDFLYDSVYRYEKNTGNMSHVFSTPDGIVGMISIEEDKLVIPVFSSAVSTTEGCISKGILLSEEKFWL
jgi:hypothetical protein